MRFAGALCESSGRRAAALLRALAPTSSAAPRRWPHLNSMHSFMATLSCARCWRQSLGARWLRDNAALARGCWSQERTDDVAGVVMKRRGDGRGAAKQCKPAKRPPACLPPCSSASLAARVPAAPPVLSPLLPHRIVTSVSIPHETCLTFLYTFDLQVAHGQGEFIFAAPHDHKHTIVKGRQEGRGIELLAAPTGLPKKQGGDASMCASQPPKTREAGRQPMQSKRAGGDKRRLNAQHTKSGSGGA